MEFKARKENSIIVMLLVLPIISTILTSIMLKMNLLSSLLLLLICYIFVFFIISAITSTKYILEDNKLVIYTMGLKRIIPYKDIQQIYEQNGLFSIEAPSIPQVCIKIYNNKVLKVSPENREEFVNILNEKREEEL